jgi:hypothetical protein
MHPYLFRSEYLKSHRLFIAAAYISSVLDSLTAPRQCLGQEFSDLDTLDLRLNFSN